MTHDPLKSILFDFDGTLLDSFSAHFAAYEDTFAHFDIAVTKQDLLDAYAPNWYETYKALGLPRAVWSQADAFWVEAASQHTAYLFPGVKETLMALAERYRLGIVTSGSKPRVSADLKREGIASLFEVIITGDDVDVPKPDPEGLVRALRTLALRPAEALYVGDAPADYAMARSLDMAFVGIKSAFVEAFPDPVYPCVASVQALPAVLAEANAQG